MRIFNIVKAFSIKSSGGDQIRLINKYSTIRMTILIGPEYFL